MAPAPFRYPSLLRHFNRLSLIACPLVQQEQNPGAGYLPRRMYTLAYDVLQPLFFFSR
jgi:hypothetical protein